MVIGGIAASLIGRPRATRDIDVVVWIDSGEWDSFLKSGENHGFYPRLKNALDFAKENRVLLLCHRPSGIDVDISFGALPFEKEAIRRSVKKRIKGFDLALPTPEDLVIMKAVAHRQKDLVDIDSILDVNSNLDRSRVRRWVKEFAKALEMPELVEDLEKIIRAHKKR